MDKHTDWLLVFEVEDKAKDIFEVEDEAEDRASSSTSIIRILIGY